MVVRRNGFPSTEGDILSPELQELIEEIWPELDEPGAPDYRELINLALRRLEMQLGSHLRGDIVREARLEIEYRSWRAGVSD